MSRWVSFAWVLLAMSLLGATVLPSRPQTRVSDRDALFDPKTRDFLSQTLRAESGRYKISGYVVAIGDAERGKETEIAKQLRDKWIPEPVGFIVLFTGNSDKISISLTDEAYRRISIGGKLDLLAKQIDEFNEDGPSRGMPKVINLLLDRLRLERKAVVVVPDRDVPVTLILVPIGILLAGLGWGMFRLYRYMESQNIFTPLYVLKADRVQPVLGSTLGGVNTVEARY